MTTTSAEPLNESLDISDDSPACVLTFNANDPCGAGGLSGDIMAIASIGGHALPVMTGSYVRDTTEIVDYFGIDEEAIEAQARTILEDVQTQAIKVGFVGSPEAIATIAAIATDYSQLPLLAYMPSLSWWTMDKIDVYLDAYRDLLLPQTSLLVGNHSTLRRWLLPDWEGDRTPTARDIARAAAEYGVPYTLVTGIHLPDQFIENTLSTPESVVATAKFERFEAVFAGAGDTLSAALIALISTGCDLGEAFEDAMGYLDQALNHGFRPGMGHVIADRLFWVQPEPEEDEPAAKTLQTAQEEAEKTSFHFEMPTGNTKH